MLGNISAVQLGIVLLIVILIFGTRKLRNLGEDLGGGIKGVRDGFGGDLSEAAEEIAATKKSLEELRDTVNGKRVQASSTDSQPAPRSYEPRDEEYESSDSYYSGQSSSRWDSDF